MMGGEGEIVHGSARPEEDVVGAVAALAEELAAPPVPVQPANRPEPAHGPVTSAAVAQTLAALIPENAVIVDESISFGFAFYPGTKDAAPHEWLQVTGGAIGGGCPRSAGAPPCPPELPGVNFEDDGSPLHT